MPDNNKIGRKLVHLENQAEVGFWMNKFQCSENDLKRAVSAVGRSARQVGKVVLKIKTLRDQGQGQKQLPQDDSSPSKSTQEPVQEPRGPSSARPHLQGKRTY